MKVGLLTLVLAALACAVPVDTAVTPLLTPTPNATTTALPTPIQTTNATLGAEVIAFEALHVRAAPGYQAEIIDYLYVGEEVTLTGRCSDAPDPKGWAEIRWNGSTAWVNSKFLSANKCQTK